MRKFFLLLLLFPMLATAQFSLGDQKATEEEKKVINQNIFRLLLGAATDTKFSLMGNYEREIARPFTVFFKAGLAFDRKLLSTDVYGNDQYSWLLNATGSGEFRYYYNLKRRERLGRTVRNFSALYVSAEEQIISRPIFILNNTGEHVVKAGNKSYINIGYQYEESKTYYNFYVGFRIPIKAEVDTPTEIGDLFHAGITIGRVFK